MRAITLDELGAIAPATPRAHLELFIEPLNATFSEFEIDTFGRQTHFVPQVAHESAGFRHLRELASGEDYDPAVNPKLAAHLGNTQPGDGRRFKGRGLVQITGRKNYGLCAAALGLELLEHPELLEEPIHACRSAGWFWTVGAGLNLSKRALAHGIPAGVNLNDIADRGDFEGITLAINGGLYGQDDRLAYFRAVQSALA